MAPYFQQSSHQVAFVLITAIWLDVKIYKIISLEIMPHAPCVPASRADEV